MKKRFDELNFRVFGFQFKLKNFLLTLAIALGVLCLLIAIDSLWLDISWYGVIIGTGFLVAIVLCTQLCKERNLPSDYPYDLIWWVFPLSIIGARTYYVLFSLDEFTSFWQVFEVWKGGIAIYGGIIGGLLGIIICCAIKKKNVIATTDVAAPVLILAQAIGRWGNFVNQEVYGKEVTNKAWQWFPFAVHITEYGQDGWYLATFFYESLLCLIGFFVLTTILRKSKTYGIVSSSYLIYYGIVRFFLEGLRVSEYILYIPNTSFPVSQAVSLAIILTGVIWLSVLLIKKSKHKNAENQKE